MHPHLLLFDVDGTILLTDGAGMRAMEITARRMFGPDIRFNVDAAGRLDTEILDHVMRDNNRTATPDQHHAFHNAYLPQLTRELAQPTTRTRLMPGIQSLLQNLHQRADRQHDIALGLLTGNYTGAARLKLQAARIDPDIFTLWACAEQAPTRPDLVALAISQAHARYDQPIDPHRVIVIGDTPRDIDCARAHHCRCIAVATGRFSLDELAAHKPDVLVKDLEDPTPLYNMIDS